MLQGAGELSCERLIELHTNGFEYVQNINSSIGREKWKDLGYKELNDEERSEESKKRKRGTRRTEFVLLRWLFIRSDGADRPQLLRWGSPPPPLSPPNVSPLSYAQTPNTFRFFHIPLDPNHVRWTVFNAIINYKTTPPTQGYIC